MKKYYSVLLLILVLSACTANRPIRQGIKGQVLWFEGDLMPGIDKKPVEGKPVIREIYFYAPTHTSQAREIEYVFYSDIKTNLIATTESDEEGRFSIRLEPGTYSVFVKEPRGLFANRYNEFGLINPVKVMPNEVSEIDLRIDYEAAY